MRLRIKDVLASLAMASSTVCASAEPLPYAGLSELPQGAIQVGTARPAVNEFGYESETRRVWHRATVYPNYFAASLDNVLASAQGGEFEWSVYLDETGAVSSPGSASLALDFGQGSQVYARGTVTDFGLGGGGCSPLNFCSYILPSVTIRLDLIDALLAPTVGEWWQWIGFFSVFGGEGSFLDRDFLCSRSALGVEPCRSFSHDDLFFYRISEPNSLALALGGLVSLLGIALVPRKRSAQA